MTDRIKIEVVQGVEGHALYINSQRVAGPKPWGGGEVVRSWTVDSDRLRADLTEAGVLAGEVEANAAAETFAQATPARLSVADLRKMPIGAIVYVASALVPRVPYKRTRKGWQTFSPSSGRANGAPLTSETIAERGAWTR